MTEKEMIEEMTKKINNARNTYFRTNMGKFRYYIPTEYSAKELLKHYQPKLPEGSVVLTKEEFNALLLEQKRLKEVEDRIPCGYELKETTRKETAKEIFAMLRSIGSLHLEFAGNDWNDYLAIDTNDFNKIAKQYGVGEEE